jgi:chemotaxis protein methyltransferase CheR
MALHPDNLGLSTTALPLLRDLVHERLGIHYDNTRIDALTDRVAPLVIERGFPSFLDYYYLLKYDAAAGGEWPKLMDALSVPETYFWREIDQMRAVVNLVLPELVRAYAGRTIRIWSVPCATGEEPLTLAMLLEDEGWFERARIEIHAADASPAAIARAMAGRYRQRSFRALSPDRRARYFHASGDEWVVAPSLHARVSSWSVINMMADAETAALSGAPIVFCRNMFIYFSEAGVRHVVGRLGRLMPSPGYLCVGASESLLKITSRFQLEELGSAFVYVKRN